jgi:hypothetical protein
MRIQEKWLETNTNARDCGSGGKAYREARQADSRLCSVVSHWFIGQGGANEVHPVGILAAL